VVDNDRAVRLAAESALEMRGFEVDSVPDPQQGLKALRRRTYDLAVANARLPRMDGLELTATILEMPGIARFPVVLLDERLNPKTAEVARSVGAAAYLRKPTGWMALAETLLDLATGWGRRRFERFPLQLKVEAEGTRGPARDLTDQVGRAGIQICTSRDVPVEARERYRITLPGTLGMICVDGCVVYRWGEPGRARLRAGVRFLQFPDKDEPRWIALIENLARRGSG
jgi:CheY-like chemotaxis protein